MFITFSATEFVGGNGFLALYICAVYLGNQDLIHKRTIMKMFDGLAWLMQIVLFLTLGLLVFPKQIVPFIGLGLIISAFQIFVARPVGVFIALLPFRMKIRRRFYISWVGLRGAVPIVFATYPLLAGIDKANMIFNIVFFISVTSVMIQGTTLSIVAKWLNVALPDTMKPLAHPVDLVTEHPRTHMEEIEVSDICCVVDKRIVDLGFPKSALIAMIKRDDKYLTPNGTTVLQANDTLIVLSDSKKGIEEVYELLEDSA